MTSESEVDSDQGAGEGVSLLDRLERKYPSVAAAAVDREIELLLGRQKLPAVPHTQLRKPRRLDDRSSERPAFEWYQLLVSRLPPVLSREAATEAAKAVEAGVIAQARLEISPSNASPEAYLRELDDQVERGKAAYELLVVSNLRLVFHWCKGIAKSVGGDWVQDGFQAGCLGLMRGIRLWDHSMGYAVSTYVSWHIRQQIQRWKLNETHLIRLPVHVWAELESTGPRLSPERHAAAMAAQQVLPLDSLDEDEPSLVWDGGLEAQEELIDRTRAVERALSVVSQREASILMLHNGLSDKYDEPKTLDEIGEIFGLTRERIRQIEAQAIKTILARMPLDPCANPSAKAVSDD